MKTLLKRSCWLYDRVLSLYNDSLLIRHGEEMRFLFRRQLADALRNNPAHVASVWRDVALETLTIVGPTYLGRLRLLTASTLASSALVGCFLLGFCSFSNTLVHACTDAEPLSLATPRRPPNQRPHPSPRRPQDAPRM